MFQTTDTRLTRPTNLKRRVCEMLKKEVCICDQAKSKFTVDLERSCEDVSGYLVGYILGAILTHLNKHNLGILP